MAHKISVLLILFMSSFLYDGQAIAGEETKNLQAEYIKEIDMDHGSLSRSLDVLMRFLSPSGRETRSFLKDVRRIKMAVYKTDHLDNENKELRYLLEDLEADGWDRVINVREREEQVWIMMRGYSASIKDIYIVSINPDELIEVQSDHQPDRMIAHVIEQSAQRRRWKDEDGDDRGQNRGRNRSEYRHISRTRKYVVLNERYPDGYDDLHVRYNRVDGGYIGFREQGEYRARFGLTPFGEVGYAFSSKRWQYQAGGEVYKFLGQNHLLSSGFEIHDRTETQDAWLVGEMENSFSGALFRDDFRDYYRRKGWSAYGVYNIHNYIQLSGRYLSDEFESLSNTINWGIFENKYANNTFRLNPLIDEGRINSARVGLRFDTRNRQSNPYRGWLLSGLAERAGGSFGGNHAFDRYTMDLRRYQSLGRDMRFDVRLRLGSADGVLPNQYLYDLGGISTIRGYGYKSFTGDRMMLFNAEYWFDNDLWHSKWPMEMFTIGAFFDAGSAWFSQTPLALIAGQAGSGGIQLKRDIRSSAGVGVKVAGIRAYFARQLDSNNKDWQVSFRINRTF